jgi:hypothetical protein
MLRATRYATLAALTLTLLACSGNLPGLKPAKPPVAVDMRELLAAWEKNPVATREKYAGDEVRVEGYLVEVSSTIRSEQYVIIGLGPEHHLGKSSVQAFIPDRHVLAAVGKVNKGDKVAADLLFKYVVTDTPKAELVRIQRPPAKD